MRKPFSTKNVCSRCGVNLVAFDTSMEVLLCETCVSTLEQECVEDLERTTVEEVREIKSITFLHRCIAWITLFAVLGAGLTTAAYFLMWAFNA